MKKVVQFTIVLSIIVISASAFCKDLTGYDLDGFSVSGKRSILSFKDLKLPKPNPPNEDGIETGAVFILGRYVPPPYEVTVEGIHVLINGIPCTNLRRLLETEEDRQFRKKRQIAGPLITRLRDLYQRTKHYEGEAKADQKLQKTLDELNGFRVLGVDRIDDKNRFLGIAAHKKYPNIDQILDELIEIKPGETKQDAINRYQSKNHGIVKILGFDEVYGPVKKTTVRLSHQEIGGFEVEVDSTSAEKLWIENEGCRILHDKQYELQKKYGQFNQEKIRSEVKKYALSLPWIKTFEFKGTGYNLFNINGIRGRFAMGYIPGKEEEKLPNREEIDERLKMETIDNLMPTIKEALKKDCVIFLGRGHSKLIRKTRINLIANIKKIVSNDKLSYLEKRNKLIELFEVENLSVPTSVIELLAVDQEEAGK